MIEFSDPTVIEGHGNYLLIKEIMNASQWMLETNATVIEQDMIGNYVLHLWENGTVMIMSTDHPTVIDAPDSDLRRLREWCEINGWKLPSISNYLIDDQQGFDFWLRMYQSGIIHNDKLQKHDDDDMKRLSDVNKETENVHQREV